MLTKGSSLIVWLEEQVHIRRRAVLISPFYSTEFVAKQRDPVFVKLVTEQRVLRSFKRQIDGKISTNSKLFALI